MRRRKPKRAGCTHIETMAYEVEWYRSHGKYPDRIKKDDLGHEYVEGDHAWNNSNHFRQETIWRALADHVYFRVTGLR